MSQSVQNSLNFIPSNWGYFWNLDPYEMGTYSDIDHFLTNFNGEMLQIRLKTHQLITKSGFCAFCDQGGIFKLLIFKLIYKCTSYNRHYVKWGGIRQ